MVSFELRKSVGFLKASNLPSNVSDAEINSGVVTLGQNLGRVNGVDPDRSHKPNFNTIWKRHGAVVAYAKEIVSISSAVLAQCTNVTERNRPRNGNGNIDRMPAMSLNNIARRLRLTPYISNFQVPEAEFT